MRALGIIVSGIVLATVVTFVATGVAWVFLSGMMCFVSWGDKVSVDWEGCRLIGSGFGVLSLLYSQFTYEFIVDMCKPFTQLGPRKKGVE